MLRNNRLAPVSPAANPRLNREADTARQNLNRTQTAMAEFDKALKMPTPFNLSPTARREWNELTAWLQRTRSRLDQIGHKMAKGIAQAGLGVAGTTIPGASVLTNAIGGAFGSNLAGQGGRSGGRAGAGSMVAEMAAMNMQFLALQNAVQMESRKFQTLSNASRARHDIAMKSINNTRA